MRASHRKVGDFVRIIQSIKKHLQVLPLAALGDALAHPERHYRSVFLMSDDGCANTLTMAADVLEDIGVPWTLFVSTHHIDTGERSPTFLARLFFYYAPRA